MKIFIDFDDVLFDTRRFIFDIKKIFAESGVSEEIFEKYYKDKTRKNDNKIGKYNPYKQIRKIKKLGFETKKIEIRMNELLKNTARYLFKDGINFLKKFKDEYLYIASFGDKHFQKERIINSGIGKYFKKIIVVDVSKAIGIKRILRGKNIEPGEAIIFIDDRVKFLEDIKKSYPGMVTFLMKRPEGRYGDEKTKYCDFEVANFDDVIKIIEE
jgi:FMN phosphatase YigB (HAD superfamily)